MIESTYRLLWIFVIVFLGAFCTYGKTIRTPPITSVCLHRQLDIHFEAWMSAVSNFITHEKIGIDQLCQITKPNFLFDLITTIIILCFPPLHCQFSLQSQVLLQNLLCVLCTNIFHLPLLFFLFFWFNMDVLDIYLFQMSWVFIIFLVMC